MKKYLAIVFVVALLLCMAAVPAFADGSIEISVETDVSKDAIISGEPFTATIWVTNSSATPLGGLDLTIVADGFDIIGNPSINNDPSLNIDISSANGALLGVVFKEAGCAVEHWWVATVQMTAKSLGNKTIGATVRDVYDANYGNVTGLGQTFSTSVTVTHTQHDWVEGADSEGWKVTKDPTCTETGLKEQKCETEGCPLNTKPNTQEIEKIPHTAGAAWQTDGESHWHLCSVCGEVMDKDEHTGEIKDNEDGKTHSLTCEVCGYASAAENHSSSAAPKSDSTGHWYICDACGAEFGKDAHTVDEQTWKSDDSYHWHECSVCEYKVGQEAHTPGKDANITKYPTCTEPGEGTYECTKCGKAISGTIAPLEHKWDDGVIKEGDEPTYRKEGTKTFTCQNKIGADETPCGETKTEAVAKLQLASNTVTFAAGTNPDYVNNMTAMQEPVEAAVKQAVADMLENEEPTGISAELKKAIADVLDSKEDGKSLDIVLKADVAVVADEAAVPAALKESIDTYFAAEKVKTYSFAAGLSFDLTATVNGTAVGAPVTQLPVGAQFNLTVPVAPPIHCLFGQAGGTVGGMGQFSGTFSDVNPSGTYVVCSSSDLSLAAVQYTVESTYTGSAVEPAVELVINGDEKVDPKYYSVEYKDNTAVTDKAQIIVDITDEGKAAGFTLEEPMTFTFTIAAAPATPTPKPTGNGSGNNGNAPDTGDETNVALYAVVLAVCTAALVLVVTLRKKSSR